MARKNGFKALIAGGTENHIHILLSLPATMASAKAMQLIKGASSHWMNEKHTRNFAWQEGYGASSIFIGNLRHRRSQCPDERLVGNIAIALIDRNALALTCSRESPASF